MKHRWLRRLGVPLALIGFAMLGPAAAAAGPPPPAAAQTAVELAAAQLPEPLVATGPTAPAEDAALLAAVTRYQNRSDADDFSALTGFLAAHPKSVWRAALETDLGIVYRHYGYLSRALDAFAAAWRDGKDATPPPAKALVDRAIGELVRLDAALGRKEQLAALLAEIGNRPVSGPGTEMVQNGRDTLRVMQTDPKHLYDCGPLALKMLLLAQHAREAQVSFLDGVRADGPQGTSLAEVAALATRAKAALVPVFRKSGKPVPVPSIVHWRVGHFAALTGEREGRYEIRDLSVGHQSLWVTRVALDAEASGYFLVPAGMAADGWRRVAAAEAGRVRGAGNAPANDNTPKPCGMCGYGISEEKVSLTLADTPVGYAPAIGPSVGVSLSYDMYDVSQPANFRYFNVGQKWTLNWLGFIVDDPTAPTGANVQRYSRDSGFLYPEVNYDPKTHRFLAEEDDASTLVLAATNPITYQRFLRDGTIETYAQSDGSASFPRNVFLTRITDPQGNPLSFGYGKTNGQVRLVSLTDATGRRTTFGYGSGASPLLITRITDPFGRSAELTYDANGRLRSITDVIGLTSSFTYDSASLINALTTPYGTTRFAYGAFNAASGTGDMRFLNIVDPLGFGEREETFEPASFVPFSEQAPQGMVGLFNQYLPYRNSFHWNKHQYSVGGCTTAGGCNYNAARIAHFTHDAVNTGSRWSTFESLKEPLENRVWYTTPGQTGGLGAGAAGTYDQPSAIGRVLDDGQTQLTQLAYNAAGNPTEFVDPLGRQTTLIYAANQIDLLKIQKTAAGRKETIASFTWNDRHRPLTYTDAAGATTHCAYNGAGQLTSITNPLGQTTSLHYNGTGDLTQVVNADGKPAARFTYDAADRVASYTDAGGRTVTYDYDAANRLTKATYPDGTFEKYVYDRLDLVSYKDRQSNVWRYAHDADRRLTAITDPLGHVTRYAYYADGTLKSVTDPNDHTTRWDIDVESRPIAKHFADDTVTKYHYENTTSRLASETDALGQTKNYSYTRDNRLAGISYLNAVHPTRNVAFTYDPFFPRLTAMTDGTGTTRYSYVPFGRFGALQLASENGTLPNSTIAYAYDALGRVVSRTVDGASPERFAYDKIGRLIGHDDALGKFALSYLGETALLSESRLVGGSVATTWSYLPNIGDRRLAAIANAHPGERRFEYVTTPEGLIEKISEEKTGSLPQSWSLVYDSLYRLSSAASTTGAKYGYRLDPVGNILSFATPSATIAATYNKVNALTTVAGKPFVYDADGNLLSDGVRGYSWDAENRLIAITRPGSRSSFAYDGLNRRIAITDTASGKTTTTRYIWCGSALCQSRGSATAVQRLYYPEGEAIPAARASLYYGPDQLDSVRDVFATSPVFSIVQRYDYDPYGNPTKTPATGPIPDFRYAGMLYHADSGLYLTQYRAYDPRTARWLSRDPRGGGLNPYAYVDANPIGATDRSGLQAGVDPSLILTDPNLDVFFLWEFSAGPPGLPVTPESAAAGFVGYNSEEGPYHGFFGLVGVKYGGETNYVARSHGVEITYNWRTGETKVAKLKVSELNVGPEEGIGGGGGTYSSSDPCKTENGSFLHLSGGAFGNHGAIGVGSNIGEYIDQKWQGFVQNTVTPVLVRDRRRELGLEEGEVLPPGVDPDWFYSNNW